MLVVHGVLFFVLEREEKGKMRRRERKKDKKNCEEREKSRLLSIAPTFLSAPLSLFFSVFLTSLFLALCLSLFPFFFSFISVTLCLVSLWESVGCLRKRALFLSLLSPSVFLLSVFSFFPCRLGSLGFAYLFSLVT